MTKIYIAIPSHSNMVTVDTAICILDLERYLTAHGIKTQTAFHSSSMISHLRNTIIAHFLAGDATHVLMIDSDQALPADLVGRMIAFNKPLVGVIYPRRNYNFNQVRFSDGPQSAERVLTQALRFVGDLSADDQGEIEIVNGFARAKNIGTGAMLIRRDVIETLITHYPDLFGAGFPDEAEYEILARNNWGFFNPYTKQSDGENSGEDVAFCNRYTKVGGEIWADVTTNTTHIGRHAISGNILAHIRSFD